MSFDKVVYTDKVTKIMAKNLNDIQNELGNLSERIDSLSGVVFWATYNETTEAEVTAAVTAGKTVLCKILDEVFYLVSKATVGPSGSAWIFASTNQTSLKLTFVSGNYWNNISTRTIPSKTSDLANDSGFLAFDQCDYVSPEMFGAKGNGTADDTIAWQKAVDSGKNVVALSSKYLCSQINITRNVSIDCNNAEFTCSSPILFNASGEEKATLTGQTDYSANLSDYQIADEAYADYSGFAVLQGTNNFDTSRSYYYGGFACTFSNGKIDCAYPIDVTNNQNGITIKIIDPITISIKNLGSVIRSGSGATETSAIKITYGLNCLVENINASSLMGTHAIAFWSCLNCVCRNNKIAKTYGTTGTDSYIISFLDSSFCKVKDSYLYNQYWHCVSLGGNYLCYKNSVDNCTLLNDSGRAYSDHENAVGTMLLNSVITSAAIAGQAIIDNVRIVSNKDGNKSCHILVQGQTDSRLCGVSICNVDFMPDDASSSCGILLNAYPQSLAADRTFIFDRLCLKNINVLHPTKKGLFWFAFRGSAVQYRYFKVGSIRFDNVNLTIQLTNSNPNADLTTMDAKQVVYEAVS